MCLEGRLKGARHISWPNVVNMQAREEFLETFNMQGLVGGIWREYRRFVPSINSPTQLESKYSSPKTRSPLASKEPKCMWRSKRTRSTYFDILEGSDPPLKGVSPQSLFV